jgi:hypothetical protein
VTATLEPGPTRAPTSAQPRWARLAPTLVAALLAAGYVIVDPPSLDLAAHLYRAQLFATQGFAVWDNYWYAGHHILGYSALFPAVSAALSPQLAAGLAAVATAAVFEPLARRHFGDRAWLGAVLFGAATAIDLYTGRLALAFGALPALGAVVALDRGWAGPAGALAIVSALCSPVAALFTALAATAHALDGLTRRRRLQAALPGAGVAVAALAPVGLLAIAFPEGGTEPFSFLTLAPILLIAAGALLTLPTDAGKLRAGVAVYAAATILVYLVPSPIGSNIARLGTFLAAPLAALVWWRRRMALLAVAAVPLLYVGWQAPVSDVATAAGDPTTSAGYYQPLLSFLRRESEPAAPGRPRPQPFRVEIPFTRSHWEAYLVARYFPLARGWERQLDIGDNAVFYRGRLTATSYEGWLHHNAVRLVALPDAALDYSARTERALIRQGLPYLRLVMRSAHWRVYAVADATPIAQGVARLEAMGHDWLALDARAAGATVLAVHFTPYWRLARGSGCVSRDGSDTRLTLRRPGRVRLVTSFSISRIGTSSPRCT